MPDPNITTDDDAENALQIFHINVNCSDFERSLEFYTLIGFRPLFDFEELPGGGRQSFDEIGLAPLFRLPPGCDGRAAFLQIGTDRWATRLDLIEWTQPASKPLHPRSLADLGVARICLKVRNCANLHARLSAGGYDVYTPPKLIDMGGTRQYVFCCEDPDGVVIEFMQFVR